MPLNFRPVSTLRACALGLGLAAPLAGHAQEVKLSTQDQSISVQGELLEFDGEFYTIRTPIGTFKLIAADLMCEGEGCPAPSKDSVIAFAGSASAASDLIPALFDGYAKGLAANFGELSDNSFRMVSEEFGEAEVSVIPSSSRDGYAALLDGAAHIALATRSANGREARAFEAAGKSNPRATSNQHVLALKALVFVTHPGNLVRAISEEDAARAFAGQITNWEDLGGPDAPITLYVPADNLTISEIFQSLVMGPNGTEMASSVEVLPDDAAVTEAVKNDPTGLGFTSLRHASGAKTLSIRGVCGIVTPASEFTVKTEEYPLTTTLIAVSDGTGLDYHAQGFLEYLSSDAAQTAARAAGFLDQTVSVKPVDNQGARIASSVIFSAGDEEFDELRDMLRLFVASDRASTTFRFETGASELDARSRDEIGRLVSYLQDADLTNKEVVFVGFTDAVGDAELNKVLSEKRAALVRDAVLAANPDLALKVNLATAGFGEASPLGCNAVNSGRRINRRVEVWVRDAATTQG